MQHKEDPIFMQIVQKGRESVSANKYSSYEYASMMEDEKFRMFTNVLYNEQYLEVLHAAYTVVMITRGMLEDDDITNIMRSIGGDCVPFPFEMLSQAPHETIVMYLMNTLSIASQLKNYPTESSATEHIPYFYELVSTSDNNEKNKIKFSQLLHFLDVVSSLLASKKCICINCLKNNEDEYLNSIIKELNDI